MSIRRAPRPEQQFLQLRNDVARDTRLTFRATGLLTEMLSYPDDWTFSRDWLASRGNREGVTAVRTALKELETCGYLVRRRVKSEDGRFSWQHDLYDTPQDPQGSTIPAGQTTGQVSTDGPPSDGNPPSYEDHDEDLDEEGKHGPSRPAPPAPPRTQNRAPAPPAHEPHGDEPTDRRTTDRALFDAMARNYLDPAHLTDVYAAERARGIDWPGAYLARIDADAGAEHYLTDTYRGGDTA